MAKPLPSPNRDNPSYGYRGKPSSENHNWNSLTVDERIAFMADCLERGLSPSDCWLYYNGNGKPETPPETFTIEKNRWGETATPIMLPGDSPIVACFEIDLRQFRKAIGKGNRKRIAELLRRANG